MVSSFKGTQLQALGKAGVQQPHASVQHVWFVRATRLVQLLPAPLLLRRSAMKDGACLAMVAA